MHLIRRAAFRAASSPSTSLVSKSRSINTSTPFAIRSKVQNGISSSVFKRFASDEADGRVESADGEQSSRSASETVSKLATEAAETVRDGAAAAAAATGFGSRNDDRGFSRQPQRDSGFSSGGFAGARPPIERNLTPTTGIYIGNLLFDITAADITREFEQFGPVKSAIIATDARGLSKGFGYIEFETIEQATKAIEAKHQATLEGRRLIVNYMAKTTRESKPNPPSKTLFIGNLAFEMSDADLNKLFRDIRNVIDVRVAIDRRTGQPRGFAHADFIDVDSAVKGMEQLTGKEIYGRKLRIDYSAGRSDAAPRRNP